MKTKQDLINEANRWLDGIPLKEDIGVEQTPIINPSITRNKFDEYEDVTGQVISTYLKKDMKMRDGTIIPMGTKIQMVFVRKSQNGPYAIKITKMDSNIKPTPILVSAKSPSIMAINAMPSMKSLEHWVSEGFAKTVTGKKVEPDGYGPDGSPSWLLVLGMI
jgi:hypothetical protein